MTDEFEPLKPLTPQQQEEFDRHRESAAVVQNKCTCGAWYETDKKPAPYTDAFFCEACGKYMTVDVPALDRVQLMGGIDYTDPDARLDTGMKVCEALDLAARWWRKTGRKMMKSAKVMQSADGNLFASLDPDNPNHLPSGILAGEPWDILSTREKMLIVKVYHHFTVRKPQSL